ncbi:FAD-dependent oxidoreductase [uncultured Duncaniella sp.]|uniref:FAD-dependent oxidoreductase n=1 Tax=uncultured Duncaniella sp. TaxID=2768039 RepID=UPI0025AE62DD|nr:FAD-dependent oxidoreductase [uncultured Duncaniella sp.]
MDNERLTSRDAEWREELRKRYTTKERTTLPRVVMPEIPASYRITCNDEVNQGLSIEQAVLEARRCLDCPDPGCMKGCPVSNFIPAFIKNVERRNFSEALEVLNLTTVLPAVCGRVCPQEKQCEAGCIYNKMKKPAVAIGHLERFVADFNREMERAEAHPDAVSERRNEGSPFFAGIKIAVVGSGPSGLAFAGDMAKRGYDVTIFEALHQFGGVLKYGIPEFCLPNDVVDAEIAKLRNLGVKFVKDSFVGHTLSYHELQEQGFKGIYVATGAGKPRFMGIPGENLPGVMTANEYLIRLNLLDNEIYGQNTMTLRRKRVAVIGAGNTAMDAVRAARRMGAEKAMIVYRRGEDEIPARADEVRHAREEGVEFLTLHNPVEYLADENGLLRAMRLQRMELGEPDESGRRVPVEIPGAIEEVEVDLVVVCVGFLPNPPMSLPAIDMSRQGKIVVDCASMQSSSPDIYAGGDIVRGAATVILAMGDGRRAAKSMSEAFENIIRNTSLV